MYACFISTIIALSHKKLELNNNIALFPPVSLSIAMFGKFAKLLSHPPTTLADSSNNDNALNLVFGWGENNNN